MSEQDHRDGKHKDETVAKEPNQGEGDRASARVYDGHVRDYVAGGTVEPAAKSAESFVDAHPDEARAAERAGKRGPHTHSVTGGIVARGKAMIERLRARWSHK